VEISLKCNKFSVGCGVFREVREVREIREVREVREVREFREVSDFLNSLNSLNSLLATVRTDLPLCTHLSSKGGSSKAHKKPSAQHTKAYVSSSVIAVQRS
jgi:hypothetical protein